MKKLFASFFLSLFFVASFALVARAQTLPTGTSTGPGGGQSGATTIELPNPIGVNSLSDLMNKIIGGLILFATPIVVVMVIYAAYLFINSKGEPAEITKARSTLLYAVVGYGILLLAGGIATIIKNFLTG